MNKVKMTEINIDDSFKIADLYFKQKNIIYSHLHNSYNKFLEDDVKNILKYGNNTFFEKITNDKVIRYYFKYDDVSVRPPMLEIENEYMYPADARERNLTYGVKLLATVRQIQEITTISSGKKTLNIVGEPDYNVPIANIPCMVRSKFCTLNIKKETDPREDHYDPGGYFIVNGSEKVVISLERMIENKPLVFLKKDSNTILHTVQVNSRSYKYDGLSQIVTVRMKKDSYMSIRVHILNEIPVFILMRALGIESDSDIVKYCVYDETDKEMANLLRLSLDSAVSENKVKILTQEKAIEYLITKMRVTKRYSDVDKDVALEQKREHLMYLLKNNFLPHVNGELIDKAYYLGFMINKLLKVFLGRESIDDRDSYVNKRVDLPGNLIEELFRQFYKKMLNDCTKLFKKRNVDDEKPFNIINQIKPNVIEQGLKAALLTGAWGKKKGVAQMLQRITFLYTASSLRRINSTSVDPSQNKLTSPRHLHPTQVGMLCVAETPEGKNVGLVKNLSLIGNVTVMKQTQMLIIKNILTPHILKITDLPPIKISQYVKVLLNGEWLGMNSDPGKIYNLLKQKKYNGEIDFTTSIVLDRKHKELRVYCDGGRLYKPLLRVDKNNLLLTKDIIERIKIKQTSNAISITNWNEFLIKHPGVVEYCDVDEVSYSMTAMFPKNVYEMRQKVEDAKKSLEKLTKDELSYVPNRYDNYQFVNYSHCEIHPSLILGVVVSNSPFPNHNQGPRNIYQYSQARQAMGIFTTAYKHRLDISYILYNTQTPLVSTRASKYISTDILPSGENIILAIACFTGYNQEDSVIMNQSAIDRGLFRSTSLKKALSVIEKNQSTSQDDIFKKPEPALVTGMRYGTYDKLNEEGFIPQETKIKNGDIIIGKISPIQPSADSDKVFKDSSEVYKSHVEGTVDKVYSNITNGDGYGMIKMRIRSERIPRIGDKMCFLPNTEVLTLDGWKSIKLITNDDKVATLKNNKLEYDHPEEIINQYYEGDMYSLKSKYVNIECTTNHNLYIKEEDEQEYKLIKAEKVLNKNKTFLHSYKNTNYSNISNINHLTTDQIEDNLEQYINLGTKDSIKLLNIICGSYQDKLYYYSAFDKNLEYVQLIALNSQYKSTIENNRIIISKENETVLNKDYFKETLYYYKGNVHCVSVPSGIIMSRLNKTPVWIGNCSRHGQKGTIGLTLPQSDMPFTKEGIVPDIIMNPNALPSRMTMGQFLECLFGKIGAIRGHEIDGTPFKDIDTEGMKDILEKFGYDRNGTEYLYNGMTGKRMKSQIFIGPLYYQRLKHMVNDKMHSRSRGPRTLLTRQPPEGRARDGGLRFGEMERDTMLAYGISTFLKERMMECSDAYTTYICDKCGLFAQRKKPKDNKPYHTSSDIYFCQGCNNTTKISKVSIPYAFKLLCQEMMSMGIAPRIRTKR